MTTNVYDAERKIFACESRWSLSCEKFDIYVDDTGFEKIEITENHVFMFAGDSSVIQAWKKYVSSDPAGNRGRPPLAGIALLVAEKENGNVIYSHGHDLYGRRTDNGTYCVGSFAGSGGFYASLGWMLTGCPEQAVRHAINEDRYSGGEVKKYSAQSQEGNVGCCRGIGCIASATLERGMIMYKDAKAPIDISIAAKNDTEVKEILGRIASGKADFSAPCEAMFRVPSLEDEEKLDAVLSSIFA